MTVVHFHQRKQMRGRPRPSRELVKAVACCFRLRKDAFGQTQNSSGYFLQGMIYHAVRKMKASVEVVWVQEGDRESVETAVSTASLRGKNAVCEDQVSPVSSSLQMVWLDQKRS